MGENERKVNVSNECGSVGEKVAREWFRRNGYEAHSFRDMMLKLDLFRHLKKSEPKLTSEKARENLQRTEKFFSDFFGGKLEDVEAYVKAIRKLGREEAETRQASHYSRVGIAPDFVVKKDGNLFFVEVKVNESEPKKYQRASFQIAKEYGFRIMTLRTNVKINVQSDVQLTEV